MAQFEVRVHCLGDDSIEHHPNADRLDLVRIGGYRAITFKGQFQAGDLVAYIPEQALVPEALLAEMNLTGKLAGRDKNRVKAIRLRGVLSQGLCYPARSGWVEGQDVTDELGITKWEPTIPASFAGEVDNYSGLTLSYDIENFKKFPDLLTEGTDVIMTEKIHGTWACFGILPNRLVPSGKSRFIITSKGLSAKGLAFKPDAEANSKNLYVRAFNALDMGHRLEHVEVLHSARHYLQADDIPPLYVLGEIFGQGVQDLSYGANSAVSDQIGFRFFDIYVGVPGQGVYVHGEDLEHWAQVLCLEQVPVLYSGPFSVEKMLELTNGKETVSGQAAHIREGVVIRPLLEEWSSEIGRVQLKSVSADYLTRKGGSEYN